MANTKIKTIAEINHRATNILIKEMGIVDTLRFLNQYIVGEGNYTVDRDQHFEGMTVKDIINDIKSQRKPSL